MTGGLVWTGAAFEPRTLYVQDGLFVADRPATVDREVDATGRWVLPPLAEAHSHRFATSWDSASSRLDFLRSGALYVANLCNPRDSREQCRGEVGGATGIDVLFTNGGLTGTGGHPVRLYEELHVGVYKQPHETFWEQNNDSTFFIVDDEEDLAAKWPLVLAGKPDLIKTLLSSSEEYELRRDDERYYGSKGLDPGLLPAIVERARAAGLRVATHVDTAADFRHALAARVDLVVHTPGYGARSEEDWERYALTEADARLARELGLVHVTTSSLASRDAGRKLMKHNLGLLKAAGVKLAIGSDQWDDALAREREALVALELFEPAELVRVWCEDTPRALFPDRRIGRLEPGCEGSLILLGGDPLADPAHLGDVELVAKRGLVLWEASRD